MAMHDNMSQEDYSGHHRRHIFGWIILGILAALIVGSLLLFTAGYLFGLVPLTFYRPFFFFPLGFLIFILFLFLIFRFAFWGWGWRRWNRGYYGNWIDSKEILRQRYARGEISKEQLEQMMRDLDATK
jgi:uncharacterized membrane protein